MGNRKKTRIMVVAALAAGFIFCFLSQDVFARCGDGVVDGAEECDNGTNNSDTRADACRTDCVLPSCGDGVVDSGEECDDLRSGNSDKIPGACRTNCRRAHCGDGVLDPGEECDDRNNNPHDGCHECMSCYVPKDNLVLSGNDARVRLCQGRYELGDAGQEGVIIITGSGMILDCNNAVLAGGGMNLSSAASIKPPASSVSPMKPAGSSKETSSRMKRHGPPVTPQDKPKADTASSPSSSQPSGSAVVRRHGTGIVIKAPDVVLHNCKVENFRTGIRLKSNGAVLFNNRVCGNSNDIISEKSGNFGVKNSCTKQQNWQENGQAGCSSGCGN
jgi:cysteine-rich repeat protein